MVILLVLVLPLLFLVTVISFPLRFSILSSSRCIASSMLSSILVIYSRTFTSGRHEFILRDSLSWIKVIFFNQRPFMPSWPGVFQFDIFSVFLSKSMSIFAFSPSSSPSNPFAMSLIHSALLLCSLGFHILS